MALQIGKRVAKKASHVRKRREIAGANLQDDARTLAHDACYRAVSSSDVRVDGRIFTGVKTTGI